LARSSLLALSRREDLDQVRKDKARREDLDQVRKDKARREDLANLFIFPFFSFFIFPNLIYFFWQICQNEIQELEKAVSKFGGLNRTPQKFRQRLSVLQSEHLELRHVRQRAMQSFKDVVSPRKFSFDGPHRKEKKDIIDSHREYTLSRSHIKGI